MKTQEKVSASSVDHEKWTFSINPKLYDQNHQLTDEEKKEINFLVQNRAKWHSKTHKILARLMCPLNDVLEKTGAIHATRAGTISVIVHEMNKRQTSFWAWSEEDWKEIFCYSSICFFEIYHVAKDCRNYLICIIYLLGNLNSHRPCGSKYYAYSVATKVFGEELVNQACDQILSAYLKLGYGKDRAKIRLLSCICDLLLTNRSPYIEDLTIHLLNSLRNDKNLPAYIRRDLLPISCALTSLGIISKPLSAKIKEGERFGNPDATNHVSPQWLKWFQRWHDTSNLAAKTKISTYYNLLKFGRWLLQKHPEVVSPEQFNRQLAIELVADINKMKIGESQRCSVLFRYSRQ